MLQHIVCDSELPLTYGNIIYLLLYYYNDATYGNITYLLLYYYYIKLKNNYTYDVKRIQWADICLRPELDLALATLIKKLLLIDR